MNITVIDGNESIMDSLSEVFNEWKMFTLHNLSFSDFFSCDYNSHLMIFIYLKDTDELSLSRARKIKIKTMYHDIPIIAILKQNIKQLSIQSFKDNGIRNYIYENEADKLPALIQTSLMPEGQFSSNCFEYVHIFEKACVKVFETACQIKLTRKDFYIKKDRSLFGYVSAIMGVVGDHTGTICLTTERSIALKIIGHMLGTSYSCIELQDIHDGMGEIVNMIAGQAKAALRNTPFTFNLTIPSVIIGLGHEISPPKNAITFVTILESEKSEELALQITLIPE